jgi:hypothetical protein
MSFNLNDASFGGGATVFNNGNTGKVENVRMSVTKKGAADADNAPDYKLILTDVGGGQVNQGFYYHKNNDMYDEKRNKDLETWLVSRVLSAAKAVVANDFSFPEVSTSKEALDSLFKIINDNCDDKLVSAYVTYGTTSKPSQYLGLRYFNFVESVDVSANMSRLKPSNSDQMVKVTADAPMSNDAGTTGSPATNW